jgi:hypothetical protein
MTGMYQSLVLWLSAIMIFLLVWFNARKFHEFHANLAKTNPAFFKLIGFDGRNLEDPKAWIRHFRIYSMLTLTFISGVICAFLFGC